jgi:hypothetical protein
MISERAKRAGLKELQIFDNFIVDYELPKHKNGLSNGNTLTINGNSVWVDSISVPTSGGNWGQTVIKLTLREKIANWLLKAPKEKKEKAPVRKISITEFFTGVSKSYEELTPIAEIAQYYEKALVQAQTMGQTALLEKLKDLIDSIKGEAVLIAMGLKKYVTERQIVDFYELVGEDKHLKLTWIKNFNRIIPEEVYEAKKDADERKIFDNYVILHYDPENNGEKMTKKEIEDKKDPILFGLIKNSKKLYYVADWKDDYCDLTLEEMFKTLGEKVLKINNKNVKTFIDKVKV